MKRDIEKILLEWKKKEEKYPLLVRGARQVGKTYIIEDFGRKHFANLVTINFEFDPKFKDCFNDLNPKNIINKIQIILNVNINKNTLIFLDEIQECPQALLSLRYFKEQMPAQPIIGAGSLMEFMFRKKDFRMPVGRIRFINLEPLSFSEFLGATGNSALRQYLSGIKYTQSIDNVIHDKLIDLLRTYLVVGGLPAVVKEYITTGNLLECHRIQTGLLETYRSDFGKYANLSSHKYLEKVFDSVPRLVGQRIKYVNIDREIRARELKSALELLSLAKITRPVYATKASGLPLGAQLNINKFKLSFLDVGLMQNACGLEAELQFKTNIMQINAGAIAEQFVAQELRAYKDPFEDNSIYFWARDKRSSSAEIDYLFNKGKYILPIEVKAGKGGKLRSLHLFLKEKKAPLGIRLSMDKIFFYNDIFSVPLYMIKHLSQLLEEML